MNPIDRSINRIVTQARSSGSDDATLERYVTSRPNRAVVSESSHPAE